MSPKKSKLDPQAGLDCIGYLSDVMFLEGDNPVPRFSDKRYPEKLSTAPPASGRLRFSLLWKLAEMIGLR